MEGIGIGPVTQFVPSKLDLRDLHLYSSYDYEVQLQNLGDMEVSDIRKWSLLPFLEGFFLEKKLEFFRVGLFVWRSWNVIT